MQRDSVGGTLTVAVLLCVVCSVLVSSTAVALRPIQEANQAREKRKNILQVAGLYEEDKSAEENDEIYKKSVKPMVVDLETGKQVPADEIDPAKYDARKAAKDPEQSVEIPRDKDFAGIGRREKYAVVYVIEEFEQPTQLVLPVYGKGLWSTLYGFISLDAEEGEEIRGLTFYQHAETPGLGGEVDNPDWKAQWSKKRAFDKQGDLRIAVARGKVDTDAPGSEYQVDALSGATITSKGVTNLLKYWLGEEGFGPYLKSRSKKE